jgi:hypothetical protein
MSLTSMSSVERVGKEYLVLFWAYPERIPYGRITGEVKSQ